MSHGHSLNRLVISSNWSISIRFCDTSCKISMLPFSMSILCFQKNATITFVHTSKNMSMRLEIWLSIKFWLETHSQSQLKTKYSISSRPSQVYNLSHCISQVHQFGCTVIEPSFHVFDQCLWKYVVCTIGRHIITLLKFHLFWDNIPIHPVVLIYFFIF